MNSEQCKAIRERAQASLPGYLQQLRTESALINDDMQAAHDARWPHLQRDHEGRCLQDIMLAIDFDEFADDPRCVGLVTTSLAKPEKNDGGEMLSDGEDRWNLSPNGEMTRIHWRENEE